MNAHYKAAYTEFSETRVVEETDDNTDHDGLIIIPVENFIL